MTQAISLKNILVKHGHEIVHVFVGKGKNRAIPDFFFKNMETTVSEVRSPWFVPDKKKKGIKIGASILINIWHFRHFLRSLQLIHQKIHETKPDVIVNFYDLLGGLYHIRYKKKQSFICIGHQYIRSHPGVSAPKGHYTDKFLFRINNAMTSIKADMRLALSFSNLPDQAHKKLFIVPPLLRQKVLNAQIENEDFILGYILNEGYAEEVVSWHMKNPHKKAHIFWDKKNAHEKTIIHRNLVFHKINDTTFIDFMRRCKAYISTAGFESICEAMYLGKPAMMIPTAGHFEQKCNALDASEAGAGISSDSFSINKLLDFIPIYQQSNQQKFVQWTAKAEEYFVYYLTQKNTKESYKAVTKYPANIKINRKNSLLKIQEIRF